MSRSAFLPDSVRLRGLLHGLHARPAPSTPRIPASGHYRTLDSEPSPAQRPSFEIPRIEPTVPPKKTLSPSRLPEPTVRIPLNGSLDDRFLAFAAWAKEATHAISVFVTDSEGLSMMPSTVTEDYLAVAAEISAAQRKLSQLLKAVEGGSTRLELGSSPIVGVRVIELISCSTDFGDFTIGLLLSEQLGSGLTKGLRAALRSYLMADPTN